MLLAAAERTAGLLTEPPPFVLESSLGDFAVTYELNVYVESAREMPQRYAALHRNILDVFNEYGVQIMTPAYEGDPPEPKVVPRERWFTAPASARRQAQRRRLEHERREHDRAAVVPAQAAVEIAAVIDVEAKAEVVVTEPDADVIGDLPDDRRLEVDEAAGVRVELQVEVLHLRGDVEVVRQPPQPAQAEDGQRRRCRRTRVRAARRLAALRGNGRIQPEAHVDVVDADAAGELVLGPPQECIVVRELRDSELRAAR